MPHGLLLNTYGLLYKYGELLSITYGLLYMPNEMLAKKPCFPEKESGAFLSLSTSVKSVGQKDGYILRVIASKAKGPAPAAV